MTRTAIICLLLASIFTTPNTALSEVISQTSTQYGIVFGDSPFYKNIRVAQTFKPTEDGIFSSVEIYLQARSWDMPSANDPIQCDLLDAEWQPLGSVTMNGFTSGERWLKFDFSEQQHLLYKNQTYVVMFTLRGSTYAMRSWKDVYQDGAMYWSRESRETVFRKKRYDTAFKIETTPAPEPLPCPELILEGSYNVYNETDLVNLAAYTSATGDINIINSKVTSLAALECLVRVGGNLTITSNNYLTDIGLPYFKKAQGQVTIANNHNLPTCNINDLNERLLEDLENAEPNIEGNLDCSDFFTPAFNSSDPVSPSAITDVRLYGVAPHQSIVNIYADEDCSGEPVTSGTNLEFAATGLKVTATQNATSYYYAQAVVDDQVSECSLRPFNYTHSLGANRLGSHSLAVLLFDFSREGEETPDISSQYIRDYIFEESVTDIEKSNHSERWYSGRSYFAEVSNGKFQFNGTVFDWTHFDRPEGDCKVDKDDIIAYQQKNNIDLSQFDRILAVTHGGCGSYSAWLEPQEINYPDHGSVMQSLGRITTDSWITNNTTDVLENAHLIHELIHTFGVSHANAYECGDHTVADGGSRWGRQDPFQIMGKREAGASVNSCFSERFGWFDSEEVQVAQRSGRYVIYPYSGKTGYVRSIKIPLLNPIVIGTNRELPYLYLTYNTPDGVDTGITALQNGHQLGFPVETDGLLVRGGEFKNGLCYKSHLLDMTPASLIDQQWEEDSWNQPDFFDSFLLGGQTFCQSDVCITTGPPAPDGGIYVDIVLNE